MLDLFKYLQRDIPMVRLEVIKKTIKYSSQLKVALFLFVCF